MSHRKHWLWIYQKLIDADQIIHPFIYRCFINHIGPIYWMVISMLTNGDVNVIDGHTSSSVRSICYLFWIRAFGEEAETNYQTSPSITLSKLYMFRLLYAFFVVAASRRIWRRNMFAANAINATLDSSTRHFFISFYFIDTPAPGTILCHFCMELSNK